jgi:DNA-binding transcriptional regulator YbjK
MPANPQRRAWILDAAIDILTDTGIGGLTHWQVDDHAGLPTGTVE